MPAKSTRTTAAGKQASQVRQRPLVSPDLVRRWAAQAGLMVRDGKVAEAWEIADISALREQVTPG